jgi:hypothetical protein
MPRFHLGWFQRHVSDFVLSAGTGPLFYVLVPEGTGRGLSLFEVDVISENGRPGGTIKVNQLQLATPRDPDLTQDVPRRRCAKEARLIAKLQERAKAAGLGHLLPAIVPTEEPPPWARFGLAETARKLLWRAGGVG